MRVALCLLLLSLSASAMAAEFQCSEPRGGSMSSDDGHKLTPNIFPVAWVPRCVERLTLAFVDRGCFFTACRLSHGNS